MRNLVAADQLVDRVASDAKQLRDFLDVEDSVHGFVLVRGNARFFDRARWKRARDALDGAHDRAYTKRKNARIAAATSHGERLLAMPMLRTTLRTVLVIFDTMDSNMIFASY